MKSFEKLNLIVIGILLSMLLISNINFICNTDNNRTQLSFHSDRDNLKLSVASESIHIDNNWTETKAAGKCSGSGTYSDPFIIQNLEINGGGTKSCIFIENSQVYFTIKNCKLYNAYGDGRPEGGGIYFMNVSNGYIIKNQVNENTYVGINLISCNNISIMNNDASNQKVGIALIACYNTTVEGNTLNHNNADSSLFLVYSDYNVIIDNSLSYNHRGINLWYSNYNNISGNYVGFNGNGIWIYEYSQHNMVYLNCFTNNSISALDEYSGSYGPNTNQWDNCTVGNYWSDYTGMDSDGDGIGDTPYNITQSTYNSYVTNQDNFPLMECPLSFPVDNSEGLPIELIIIISVISGGALIGIATLLLIIRKKKRT